MKHKLLPKSGFTLLEILLVVAAIAILAGVVIVAVNPGKQLADTRNATRQTDVKTISDAVYQYSFDHGGMFPSGIDMNLRMLGTSASGCGTTCGSASVSSPTTIPQTITDNSASAFNAGSYSSTIFNTTNNLVQLISGESAGTYTSGVKDGGSDSATWSTLAWIPQFPAGKELPNNGGGETGYPSGNIDMTGNVLLLHLNESAGATTFVDSSGNNNNGSCATSGCPTSIDGKFNSAFNFDGINDYINLGTNSNLYPDAFTISAWINPSTLSQLQTIYVDQGSLNARKFLRVGLNGVIYAARWNGIGNNARVANNVTAGIEINKWQHVVLTYTGGDSGTLTVYKNAVLISNSTVDSTSGVGTAMPSAIGAYGNTGTQLFMGKIDEVALFNRAFSAGEILNIYNRGVTRLKFQVRSCSDSACIGQSFFGPDGTANTFFTELSNNTLSTPSFALSNVGSNRYFQYQTTFETDNATYSPGLKSVSVGGTTVNQPAISGTSGPTLDACLDLSSQLVSDYLNAIPVDSKLGSANNTYYAVKKTSGGRIMVQACAAENGKSIMATK